MMVMINKTKTKTLKPPQSQPQPSMMVMINKTKTKTLKPPHTVPTPTKYGGDDDLYDNMVVI